LILFLKGAASQAAENSGFDLVLKGRGFSRAAWSGMKSGFSR